MSLCTLRLRLFFTLCTSIQYYTYQYSELCVPVLCNLRTPVLCTLRGNRYSARYSVLCLPLLCTSLLCVTVLCTVRIPALCTVRTSTFRLCILCSLYCAYQYSGLCVPVLCTLRIITLYSALWADPSLWRLHNRQFADAAEKESRQRGAHQGKVGPTHRNGRWS